MTTLWRRGESRKIGEVQQQSSCDLDGFEEFVFKYLSLTQGLSRIEFGNEAFLSQDKYLHTNCLAALANMSAQFRNLHPYVTQRIVRYCSISCSKLETSAGSKCKAKLK